MTTLPYPSSSIFSTQLVSHDSPPPAIVVGLPRSGSSFLAHVLSTLENWYLFDDLYPYQKAKACGAQGALSPQQQKTFVDGLAWATRARIKWEQTFRAPNMTWDDVDRMEQAIHTSFDGHTVCWQDALAEWMVRLAHHHGCTHWGYKTPQDFMHMEQLAQLFPGVKFIFIMRDPRKMMRSLKNLPGTKGGDGDPRQYHPIVYSLYWKMAYERVQRFIDLDLAPVHSVRFEDLVQEPDQQAQQLASFLGTTVTQSVDVKQGNSSFGQTRTVTLTDTEAWICETLIGDTLIQAGYSTSDVSPQVSDIGELLRVSTQFAQFQIGKIVSDPRKRQSVKDFIGSLVGKVTRR